MTHTIDALAGVTFPGPDAQTHNQSLRTLLEHAAPLVSKGTIDSIKDKVKRALLRPMDDSSDYAREIFWALHESWPYVHWDPSRGPLPTERARMYALYRELWNTTIYPFTSKA